jgi:hypothetical protein
MDARGATSMTITTYPKIRHTAAQTLLPEEIHRPGFVESIQLEAQEFLRIQNVWQTQDNSYRRINEAVMQQLRILEEMGHSVNPDETDKLFTNNSFLDYAQLFNYIETNIVPELTEEQKAQLLNLDAILGAEAETRRAEIQAYEAARALRTSTGTVGIIVSSLGFGFIEAGINPLQALLFAGLGATGGMGFMGKMAADAVLVGSDAAVSRYNHTVVDRALRVAQTNLLEAFTHGAVVGAGFVAGRKLLSYTFKRFGNGGGNLLKHEIKNPSVKQRAAGMAAIKETQFKWAHGHDAVMWDAAAATNAEEFYATLARGSDHMPYTEHMLDQINNTLRGNDGYKYQLYAGSVLAETKTNYHELLERLLAKRAPKGEPTDAFWSTVDEGVQKQKSYISRELINRQESAKVRSLLLDYNRKPDKAGLSRLSSLLESPSEEIAGAITKETQRLLEIEKLQERELTLSLEALGDINVPQMRKDLYKITGAKTPLPSDLRSQMQFLTRFGSLAKSKNIEIDLTKGWYELDKRAQQELTEYLLVESDILSRQIEGYRGVLLNPILTFESELGAKQAKALLTTDSEKIVNALMGKSGRPSVEVGRYVNAIRESLDRQWDLNRWLNNPLRKAEGFLPMSPNAALVAESKDEFINLLTNELDWDRMAIVESRESFLNQLYNDAASFHYVEAGSRPRHQQAWSRQLYFKDGGGYLRFHERFSEYKSIHDIVRHHLDRSAVSLAAIDVYGGNSSAGLGLRKTIADRISNKSSSRLANRLQQIYDHVVTSSWNMAETGLIGRILQTGSNLSIAGVLMGSSTSAVIGDTISTGVASMALDMSAAKALGARFKAIFGSTSKEKQIEMLGILEGTTHALTHMGGPPSMPEKSRGAIGAVLKYTGTNHITDASRASFAITLNAELYKIRNTPWARVSKRMREAMEFSGITEAHWDIIRKMEPGIFNGSVQHFSPLKNFSKGVRNMSVAEINATNALMRFTKQQTEIAVPTGSARATTAVFGPAGQLQHHVVGRFVGQSAMRLKQAALSQFLSLIHTYSRHIRGRDLGALTSTTAFLLLAGVGAAYLRKLLTGVEPDMKSAEFWRSAMLSPDALGILGDQLGHAGSMYAISTNLLGRPATYLYQTGHFTYEGFRALTGLSPEHPHFARELHKFLRRSIALRSIPFIGLGIEAATTDAILKALDPDAGAYFEDINQNKIRRGGARRVWWGAGEVLPSSK